MDTYTYKQLAYKEIHTHMNNKYSIHTIRAHTHTYPGPHYSGISVEDGLGEGHQGHERGIEHTHDGYNGLTHRVLIPVYMYVYIYTHVFKFIIYNVT